MRVWYAPLAFWLWSRGETPKSDELFYEQFLMPGNIVIDCGAHLGTLAMTASKCVGPKGLVIACEAHPRTYSYLARNIQNNACTNVKVIHTAIGDKEGTISFTDEYVSDINHISPTGSIAVPMTTIDILAKNLPSVDLIKLDIEGYELQALRGATQTLPKTKAIYFEAAPRNFERYQYSLREVILFLQERNFSCFAFNENGERYRINEDYTPHVKYENILAIKNGLV